MKITPTARFMIESGVLASLVAGAATFAVIAYKVEAQSTEIKDIRVEHKLLAQDLVATQKDMIKDLTEIKTILKSKERK